MTASAQGRMGGKMGRGMMGCGIGNMMARMMGRGSMMGGSRTPAYDTMTINGNAYPATEPLLVRQGERVRLRLINASADHTLWYGCRAIVYRLPIPMAILR